MATAAPAASGHSELSSLSPWADFGAGCPSTDLPAACAAPRCRRKGEMLPGCHMAPELLDGMKTSWHRQGSAQCHLLVPEWEGELGSHSSTVPELGLPCTSHTPPTLPNLTQGFTYQSAPQLLLWLQKIQECAKCWSVTLTLSLPTLLAWFCATSHTTWAKPGLYLNKPGKPDRN